MPTTEVKTGVFFHREVHSDQPAWWALLGVDFGNYAWFAKVTFPPAF